MGREKRVNRKERNTKAPVANIERQKVLERVVFGGSSQFTESNFAKLVSKEEKKRKKEGERDKEQQVWKDSDDDAEEIPTQTKIARKMLKSSASAASTKWANQIADNDSANQN